MQRNIPILILAAGSSSRLGQAKQLVRFRGKTLLENAVAVAAAARLGKTYVVLGSEAEKMLVQNEQASCIINENWASGMGVSIAAGIAQLIDEEKEAHGVIIMLCDQPFVSAELLEELAEKGMRQEGIVICDYGEGAGPPSYFSKTYFSELKKLEGDEGAKVIVRINNKVVNKISFRQGYFDVDTPEDLKILEKWENI